MNIKTSVMKILLAIFTSWSLTSTGVNAQYEGPKETIRFEYGGLPNVKPGAVVEIAVVVRYRNDFLKDPVRTLRQQGVDVPRSAEAPWQAFVAALRKLSNSQATKPSRSKRSHGETLHYSFDKIAGPTVILTFAGNKNDSSAAATHSNPDRFLADPIAALKAHGVDVPTADVLAWRQLTGALKELQDVHSRNAEAQSAPSERAGLINRGNTQAVTPRGWDPKNKVTVTGSSQATQQSGKSDPGGDADRPVIVGSVPNASTAGIDSRQGRGVLKSIDGGSTWTVVGTCNTTKGCLALRDACRSLKGHLFKPTNANGSSGTCSAKPGFVLKNSDPRVYYLGTGEADNGGVNSSDRMRAKGGPDLRISEYVFSLPKDNTDVKVFMVADGDSRQTSRSAATFALVAARFKNAGGNYDHLTGSDKVVLVHVVNAGNQGSTPCRLMLTVREINGAPVGRQMVATVEALAPGKDIWILIDAKSILPNNVKLDGTTFKLNVDATNLLAESNEANNEAWHNQ